MSTIKRFTTLGLAEDVWAGLELAERLGVERGEVVDEALRAALPGVLRRALAAESRMVAAVDRELQRRGVRS